MTEEVLRLTHIEMTLRKVARYYGMTKDVKMYNELMDTADEIEETIFQIIYN